MFVLVLSRWYNILRLRQKDMIDLAMLKESEGKNEYWEKDREISPRITTGYQVFSSPNSLAVFEVAKLSAPRSDQTKSDDNDGDKFLSNCATSYESVHELEQRTSSEESLRTSSKRDLWAVEESDISSNIRKSNEKPLNSVKMKEFVSETTDFMTTLNSKEEREDQTATLHEHTDALDEDELLSAITLEHD
ncbi:hypothetical protein WUBG_02870, partial [Wuchereria bancrofti]